MKPTLESDLLAWADKNLPEAVAFTRSQSGEMRHKALARIFVRRFKTDRGWGNGFEAWIEDMPPEWLSDFLALAPHLPPPPSTPGMRWGEFVGVTHEIAGIRRFDEATSKQQAMPAF